MNIEQISDLSNIEEFLKNHISINSRIRIKKGDKCCCCDSYKELQCHHVTYKDNLETFIVCRRCHTLIHNWIRRKIDSVLELDYKVSGGWSPNNLIDGKYIRFLAQALTTRQVQELRKYNFMKKSIAKEYAKKWNVSVTTIYKAMKGHGGYAHPSFNIPKPKPRI